MKYALNGEVALAMKMRDHLIEVAIDRLVCYGIEFDQMCLLRLPDAVAVLTVDGARVWRVGFAYDFDREDERYFVTVEEKWLREGQRFVPELLQFAKAAPES